MNCVPWGDALQRLSRNVEPMVMGFSDIARNPPRINNGCDAYNLQPDADEPLNSMGVNVGWEELSSLCLKLKSQHSEVEEPDGEPLEIEEPMELARKEEELRQIEQNILFKKASIALKSVKFGFSSEEQSEQREGESLRDRVTWILQQRRSLGPLPDVWPPRKRMKSSTNGLLCEDHPLKRRVRALMKQRRPNLSVPPPNIEVHVAAPPAPAQEETRNVGFQRFLSILNKGVDIGYLSRIVNDDCEGQPSHSGEEETTIVREDERRPRSRSNSPPSEKKRRKETEKPKESQDEQLQSILKTLGMSMEWEEMSKLTDRTQERLFGKRPEGREVDKSQQRGSDTCNGTLASPSDSSCTPHPAISSSHQNPHTRDTGSECRSDGEAPWVSEAAQMPGDLDRESLNSRETSFGQYEYSQEPACTHPYPAAYSQYSNYTAPQHSQYAAYHGAAGNSFPSYMQGVTPGPPHPSGYPHPPVGNSNFPGPAAAGGTFRFHHQVSVFPGGQRCLNVVNIGRPVRLRMRKRKKAAGCIGGHQGNVQATPKNAEGAPKQKTKKTQKFSQEQRSLMRLLEQMEAEEASWPPLDKRDPAVSEKREKVKAFLAQKIESLQKKKK